MDNLKNTDTIETLLFYNSDDFAFPPDGRQIRFPLTISSKEYRRLRHELENNDVLVTLDIYMDCDETESEEETRWLHFESRGKRFLKTSAISVEQLSVHITPDYFRAINEANNDSNVVACIGIAAA